MSTVARSRSARFRRLLSSDQLEFLLEAHNGLSARIVEEAGFSGIWASGLCLAAQYGVRDNNEASWTQILEMVEFMADATTIPIMVDGDTGYGNFNNVRRLVTKLEQRGVSAVCIEDKQFPKSNSFLKGERQPLIDTEEFCGKIKAGKDVQSDDDFCIVARVEALIAGWGLGEALRRAEAYHAAGADAILIHSSQATPEEVLAFKSEWGNRSPVVIVPTKYCATPTSVFHEAEFSMVIWANHLLRSAITAMKRTAGDLAESMNAMAVEDRISPLAEVFRLQGAGELEDAERRFLPATGAARAIILAASRGADLAELTDDVPKTLVQVQGEPILAHIMSAFKRGGVNDITVVRGYKKDRVCLAGLRYIDNDEFDSTGEIESLRLGLEALSNEKDTDMIVSYGDVLLHSHLLYKLQASKADMAVVVDTNWQESTNKNRRANYATCSSPPTRETFFSKPTLARIAPDIAEDSRHGEWTGLLMVRAGAVASLRREIARVVAHGDGRGAHLWHLLNALTEKGASVEVIYTTGDWLDIDNLDDLILAGSFS